VTISRFRVDEERVPGGVHVIIPKGELDLDTASGLQASLERAIAEDDSLILIDLSDCEFIDSTGVALLVRCWQRHDRAAGNGGTGRLVLCCPSAQVKRLLEITGVGSTIPAFDDREDALADLTS
jgi:stage II sporulation protein AA (anti-sigma F factor antagonist)